MQFKCILILMLFGLTCCNSKKHEIKPGKFDKSKWSVFENNNYPYRDDMLTDLINNHVYKGVKMNAIKNLLGPPTRVDNNYLFYRVRQKFLLNLPVPLHTKTLVIKFDTDSLVEWRKIHE